MLSNESYYIDDAGKAYVIGKITDKTVLFLPVKSEIVEHGEVAWGSCEVIRKATREPDDTRKPIRFKLKNQFSTVGMAHFHENKNGLIVSMWENESDTYSVIR